MKSTEKDTIKKPKKKISVAIAHTNFEKIENIKKNNPHETTSSIVDYGLSMSLEEVKKLIPNKLELEEELLKLRLEDIKKLKEEEKKDK